MGKTAYTGPIFGAKQTLASFQFQAISSGGGDGLSSVVLAGVIIPPGEDWYATEFQAYRGSTGSTGLRLTVNDDSTQVATVVLNSSVVDASTLTRITADSGEYQGTRMVSGSTLTFTVTQSSVVTASSAVAVVLSGYRRWIPSTTYTE